MDSFLALVAADLHQKFGSDLTQVALVFPNKRASLFFNQHLAMLADRPIWSPAYLTISELFEQISPIQTGDPIKLVSELYKVYKQASQTEETLDEFYFWGELLLQDFNDIDKNRVDATSLFQNLQELKEIMDTFDFLDEEQTAAIKLFFTNFSMERKTELKERFISIWNVLGPVYKEFNKRLFAQGIGYEGMIQRHTIENQLNSYQFPYKHYVFVGFNVLNKVEHALFQTLQTAKKALFYWDYDSYYLHQPNQEAGTFLAQNVALFPSELAPLHFDSLKKPKQITYISSPTENAQARYLPQWVALNNENRESDCAVVLCNENLLLPILHSIPPSVKNSNITMGFPMVQTPIYSFILSFLELHNEGYNENTGRYHFNQVISLLKHAYTNSLSDLASTIATDLTKNNKFFPFPSELQQDPLLTLLFTPLSTQEELTKQLLNIIVEIATSYKKNPQNSNSELYNQLYQESIFKAYTTINRTLTLINQGDLEVNTLTFKRLLIQILGTQTIPFHGEPVIGMQVMGLLETRNLDFKNLLMLSVNEGQLPKTSKESSFIPYNLRKAFGMTTIEKQNAVYAYHFYRLLQRAEKITLVYNSSSNGMNRGEMSRFMLQFLLETNHTIVRQFIHAPIAPQLPLSILIQKEAAVLELLHKRYNLARNPKAKFSPSALNSYIDCSLKFYFRYVAGLKKEDVVNSEIDAALFGSIFHKAAEYLYQDLTQRNNRIEKTQLEELIKQPQQIEAYIDQAFRKLFFNIPNTEQPQYNGIQLINRRVLTFYLTQLLKNDALHAPFFIDSMEQEVEEEVEVNTGQEVIHTKIGGIIDRIDSKEDEMRVVDYKTGGDSKPIKEIGTLFVADEKRYNHAFQTFLYASILCQKEPKRVVPALLYLHKAAIEGYSPTIEIGGKEEITDFAPYNAQFRAALRLLLNGIFDINTPFCQTTIRKTCLYCDYKEICKR